MTATQTAEQRHVELSIGGMTCASCAARIEKKLKMGQGELMVAVTVLVPGTPGTARSARSTTQVTVAVTFAEVPTGVPNPAASTSTRAVTQWMSWSVRLPAAADCASARAACWVRAMDADRAAEAAADSTAWWATATRPAKMIRPTKSRNAGTPMTASIAAEPRSARVCRQRRRCVVIG